MNSLVLIIVAILIEVITLFHLESTRKKCKDLGCKSWIKETLEVIVVLAMLGITLYGFASLHAKTSFHLQMTGTDPHSFEAPARIKKPIIQPTRPSSLQSDEEDEEPIPPR